MDEHSKRFADSGVNRGLHMFTNHPSIWHMCTNHPSIYRYIPRGSVHAKLHTVTISIFNRLCIVSVSGAWTLKRAVLARAARGVGYLREVGAVLYSPHPVAALAGGPGPTQIFKNKT
ncbi:hypothetical protein J6590_092759 [Homalodisca vitripennis]|nr:hypothetical protein J6590_092759 [Homalodisca vitripennis]